MAATNERLHNYLNSTLSLCMIDHVVSKEEFLFV